VTGAAVVGTGFGARVHVPALRAAGFDVVALVGRDQARTVRRAERLGVPNAMTSLGDALTLTDVDVVTIATPPSTHAALTIEACTAGRHVICEKPFAVNAAEAAAMVAAADRAGVHGFVGHEFRWAPDRAVGARAIADGLIGAPHVAAFVQYVPLVADPDVRMPDWWFDVGRGGGWLGASGSHLVDQVRTWFGDVETVSAALPAVARPTGAEDSFSARMSVRGGVEVMVQQTAASHTPDVVGVAVVAGSDGTLEIGRDGVWLSDRSGRRVLPVPDDLVLPPAADATDDLRHRYTHLELGPYTRLCEALRAAVDGRAQPGPVPVPTFADGLACTRVLDAIRTSAAGGGTLQHLAG
jgi:predicted dehydrogenase